MSFIYEQIPEKSFEKLEDVYTWAKNEHEYLARIPIHGILKHGARFLDDEYFGDENTAFRFNHAGIRSLCSYLGIRLDTLEVLERQNLATEVLNDLLAQRDAYDKLKTRELIVDESSNVIVGVVSDSYVGYSNYQLLKDVNKIVKLNLAEQLSLMPEAIKPEESNFVFKEAYSINTQMSIRFTIKKKLGIVKGKGGIGEDKTELGFQLKNSMIGDSSLNINFFLYRMICANGMIAPAGSSVNRLFHSGHINNFYNRLSRAFDEITNRVGQAGKMIQDLGNLDFSPELLAKLNLSEMIFDIIPGSKGQIIDTYKIANTPRGENKEENRILRDTEIIGHIPDLFGREHSKRVFNSHWRDNASMFDFINIFTEYAKELSPAQKIESQEKAGILADWIAKNKRKFH
jgi:23S rRNA U2552 (ribose-2'-O)-methylase RlmE/FtsJ